MVCAGQHVNTKTEGTVVVKDSLISHKELHLDGRHIRETNHKAVWILGAMFMFWTKFCENLGENHILENGKSIRQFR